MSIRILLATLEEYLTAKKDYLSGCEDGTGMQAAQKRFAQALNNYIDWRTDGVLEDRKKRISTNQNLHIADLLTSNIEESAIGALNNAPKPIDNIKDLPIETIEKWMEQYNIWYNLDRKKGIDDN